MIDQKKCPICEHARQNDDSCLIECKYCGRFSATPNFLMGFVPSDHKIYLIQGALRERQINFPRQEIMLVMKPNNNPNTFTIGELLNSVKIPQNPMEKIDRFLENISKLAKEDSLQPIKITKVHDFPLAYVRGQDFDRLLVEMKELGYLRTYNPSTGSANQNKTDIDLSMKAWARIEELKKVNRQSQQGFVACTFKSEHDHNKFMEAIKSGIQRSGFVSQSIEKPHSETILEKGLGEIRRSRFIVADLTHESKSVVFEAGFAKGLGLDVILVCKKNYWDKKKMEFYVSNYQILLYEDESDLTEKVEAAIRTRVASI